jgi:hypothetical protein
MSNKESKEQRSNLKWPPQTKEIEQAYVMLDLPTTKIHISATKFPPHPALSPTGRGFAST